MKPWLLGLLFFALSAVIPPSANACELRIIVTFTPGASSDQIVRLLKDDLGAYLGCTVIVENIPGDGGILGTKRFIDENRRDGSMLLSLTTSAAAGVLLKKDPPYDPREVFVAVGQMSGSCVLLAAGETSAVADIIALVQRARAQPGKLNWGTANNTTLIAGTEFKKRAGIETQEVWYKDEYRLFEGLTRAGGLDYGVLTCAVARQWFDSRQLRPLATLTSLAHPDFSGVPAVAQFGIDATSVTPMNGLVALRGTPEPILEKLRSALDSVLVKREADIRKANLTYTRKTPAEFQAAIAREYTAWKRVIAESGLPLR